MAITRTIIQWTIIQAFSEWLSVPNKTWTKDKIRSQTVWMESGSHALHDRGVLYKLFSNVMVSRRVTHFTAELFAKCKAVPRQSTLPLPSLMQKQLVQTVELSNKHEQTHTNRAATPEHQSCALKTLTKTEGREAGAGGEKKNSTQQWNEVKWRKAWSPLCQQLWEKQGTNSRRERKLLSLISHRLAVYAPVPGVFVDGAALRFSQLWSSQGRNVLLWNLRGLRLTEAPWASVTSPDP